MCRWWRSISPSDTRSHSRRQSAMLPNKRRRAFPNRFRNRPPLHQSIPCRGNSRRFACSGRRVCLRSTRRHCRIPSWRNIRCCWRKRCRYCRNSDRTPDSRRPAEHSSRCYPGSFPCSSGRTSRFHRGRRGHRNKGPPWHNCTRSAGSTFRRRRRRCNSHCRRCTRHLAPRTLSECRCRLHRANRRSSRSSLGKAGLCWCTDKRHPCSDLGSSHDPERSRHRRSHRRRCCSSKCHDSMARRRCTFPRRLRRYDTSHRCRQCRGSRSVFRCTACWHSRR